MIVCVIAAVCIGGCASWKAATASEQWIEMPPPAGATNEMLVREWQIVQSATPVTNATQALDLLARGIVKASGPADVTRKAEVDPATGKVSFEVTTKNSDWLGGLFKGVWSTGSAIGEWVATAAAGAAP